MSSWPMHQWIFYVSLEVEYFLLVGSLWQTGKFCTITCGQQLRIWVFNMSWRFGCDFILHHVEIHFPHAGSSPWKCWKVKTEAPYALHNLLQFNQVLWQFSVCDDWQSTTATLWSSLLVRRRWQQADKHAWEMCLWTSLCSFCFSSD
jgi:hypothetical protein